MKETFHCVINVLSRVHIGCGEVYEPTGFVIDEQKQEMTVFDPFEFIGSLPDRDREELMAICCKGEPASILEVYQFFRNRPANGQRIRLCDGFMQHYKNTLAIEPKDKKRILQELNQFNILRTAFQPVTGTPYLPGTAIKGALRTAWLNRHQAATPVKKLDPKDKKAYIYLEKKLLSYDKLFEDPFRLVKVSDFLPVAKVDRQILYAVDIGKKNGTTKGIYQIVETIMNGSSFWGTIHIGSALPGANIQKPIRLHDLLESANRFYRGEGERENRELQTAGICEFKPKSLSPNGLMLRLGRHSGAECVTVSGHRNIRIMRGKHNKPLFLDHATTSWLAASQKRPFDISELVPFGWVEIVPINKAQYEGYRKATKYGGPPLPRAA